MAVNQGPWPLANTRKEQPLILVVGFGDSVHTARWLNMMLQRGFKLVLLPVYAAPLAQALINPLTISNAQELAFCSDEQVAIFDVASVTSEELEDAEKKAAYDPWRPHWLGNAVMTRPGHLAAAIRRLRPVLVHSMVVQFGGYLALAAKQHLAQEFPLWLLSNWGSDIYLFRKLPDHQYRLHAIAASIDGYHAECDRDIRIIRQMGFRRFAFPAIPATGGTNFNQWKPLAELCAPSQRREILLKGYHGWAGRALHTLAAIHLASESLQDYTIRITLAGAEVKEMAAALAREDELDIVVEPYLYDHSEAMNRLGRARVVVGLGISDGISTTLLEAMTLGVFPIQGDRSCGQEWIIPDQTGFLISPDDTKALAHAIHRAVTDDELVDAAALRNRAVVESRWNAELNGKLVAEQYRLLISSAASA